MVCNVASTAVKAASFFFFHCRSFSFSWKFLGQVLTVWVEAFSFCFLPLIKQFWEALVKLIYLDSRIVSRQKLGRGWGSFCFQCHNLIFFFFWLLCLSWTSPLEFELGPKIWQKDSPRIEEIPFTVFQRFRRILMSYTFENPFTCVQKVLVSKIFISVISG